MFAYPIPWTPSGPSGFTSLTPVPPGWFNYLSTNFTKAVDGIGGGYYQLVGADLRVSSDVRKVKFNAPAMASPIELRGFVTIGLSDDANYATGTGALTIEVPTTFTAGMTFSGPITFNNPVTFTSGGDITLQSGCVLTAQSGSSIVVNSGGSIALNGTTTLGGAITFSTTHTYTVGPSGIAGVVDADWTPELGGTRYKQIAGSTSAVGWIFSIPAGSVITGVSVHIDPANTHSVLPTDMPVLQLHEIDPSNGSSAQISTTTDPSASVAIFEAGHTITSAVLSYTVTTAKVIQARVYGESNANSTGDGVYWPPLVTYTRTTFSEI